MIAMDAGVTATWVGVAVAALSALTAVVALILAEKQTSLQRRIAEDAASPKVWADVRPARDGRFVELVIGNSGQTVATDVKVTFSPPLPTRLPIGAWDEESKDAPMAEKRLSALTPEQKLRFALFDNSEWQDLMPKGGSKHRITVSANGPFGAVKTVEFTIDLAVYEEASTAPESGTLSEIAQAITNMRSGHPMVGI